MCKLLHVCLCVAIIIKEKEVEDLKGLGSGTGLRGGMGGWEGGTKMGTNM